MKAGRVRWTKRVQERALERIHADLQAGLDPRMVFNKYEIDRYRITPRTFAEYARYYLREWAARAEEPVEARKSSASDVLQSALDTTLYAIDAGRPIDKGVIFAIGAAVDVLKLDLNREAGRRANDKHEAWKAEHAKKQAAALDETAGPAGLTPEQLAVIKSKVLGI